MEDSDPGNWDGLEPEEEIDLFPYGDDELISEALEQCNHTCRECGEPMDDGVCTACSYEENREIKVLTGLISNVTDTTFSFHCHFVDTEKLPTEEYIREEGGGMLECFRDGAELDSSAIKCRHDLPVEALQTLAGIPEEVGVRFVEEEGMLKVIEIE